MRRTILVSAVLLPAWLLLMRSASGGAPALMPAPPGKIVQQVSVVLDPPGGGTSPYLAIVSAKSTGGAIFAKGPKVDQLYLSLYHREGAAYQRIYLSPGPTDRVVVSPLAERNAQGFVQLSTYDDEVKVVGGAALRGADGPRQLVVETHTAYADCGIANVFLLSLDTDRHVALETRVNNPCELSATLSTSSVVLTGGYYGPNDPMCCPSKPHATARLTYSGGAWRVTPSYFKLAK